MKIELVTAPAYWPVSVADAKDQMYVSGTADDDLIYSYIQAATFAAEQFLRRRLVYQTLKMYLEAWPDGDTIRLPFGQLRSITHVKYTDTDDDQSTFSTSYYDVESDTEPGAIVLKYGEQWPTDTLRPMRPIEIQFVCGWYYGIEWTAVTEKSAGDVVVPTRASRTGLAYVAGGSGTTDNSEPTWGRTAAGTTTDNDISWTAHRTIPEPIIQAIKLMVSELYMVREPIIIGTIVQELPAVKNLLTPYKLWRP